MTDVTEHSRNNSLEESIPPPPQKPMMLGPTPPAATRRTSNVERGPGVGPVDGGELTAGDPLPFGKIPMILSLKLW